jgi:peptidoglycan/LPS O-acetylase OafA/YrhL
MGPNFASTKDRFRNLDAMRGIAALSVVLFHCDGLFVKGEIFCHGFLAVDVFFILSGFVLAHTYENRLAAGLTSKAFAWLRLKRLAPVYWTGTILGTLTLIAITAEHPGTYYSPLQVAALSAMAMLLIPQLTLRGTAYPANAVAWSLAGELIVNLLYARWFHRWSNRALLAVVIAGWAASTAYAYASDYGWCFGARPSDVLLTPLRAIPGFLAGVLLFRAYRKGWLARLPKVSPLAVLALWFLIAEVPTRGATPTFDTIVVVVLSPLMIALLVRAPDEAPKPFLWLGSVSYALYASHLALVYLAGNTPVFGLDAGPSFWKASLVVAGTVGLAGLIHVLIEQTGPLRAFKTAAPG